MPDSSLPFFSSGQCIGRVINITPETGFFRGQLLLDDCTDRTPFLAVVQLAVTVDTSTPSDYLAAWETWRRGCRQLERLRLSIGDGATRIEEFTIESDWAIEWCDMDPEFVAQ